MGNVIVAVIVIVIVIGVVVIAQKKSNPGTGPGPGPGPGCGSGPPCTAGTLCVAGACVTGCTATTGCAAGNMCVAGGAGAPGSCVPALCSADGAAACPAGATCIAGGCFTLPSSCSNNLGCPAGFTCSGGKCAVGAFCDTAAGFTGTFGDCAVGPAFGVPCGTDNLLCPAPAGCADGVCGLACLTDADCPAGTACDPATGACAPPVAGPGATCDGATCASGTVCNWWGSPAAGVTPSCVAPCSSDSDCTSPAACSTYGVCGPACSSNANCNADSVCDGSACVYAPGTAYPLQVNAAVSPDAYTFGSGVGVDPGWVALGAAPGACAALNAATAGSCLGFLAGASAAPGVAYLAGSEPQFGPASELQTQAFPLYYWWDVAQGSQGSQVARSQPSGYTPADNAATAWVAPAGYLFAPALVTPAGVGYNLTDLLPAGTAGWVSTLAPGTASGGIDGYAVAGRPPLVPVGSPYGTSATFVEPQSAALSQMSRAGISRWGSASSWR